MWFGYGQYKVANPGAKKEEVDAFIESGAENVFADKVFSKADQVPCPELRWEGRGGDSPCACQVALSAYQDVQAKHEELLRLETSIRELHQVG